MTENLRLEPTAPSSSESIEYAGKPMSAEPLNAPIGRLDFAVIALRLLSLYLLYDAIPILFFVLRIVTDSDVVRPRRFIDLAPSGVFVGLGISLWVCARFVATMMVRDVPSRPEIAGQSAAGVKAAELQSLLFSVLGAGFAVYGLRHLPSIIWDVTEQSDGLLGRNASPRSRQDTLQFVIEVGAGVALFVGSRALSRLWARMTNHADPRYGDAELMTRQKSEAAATANQDEKV